MKLQSPVLNREDGANPEPPRGSTELDLHQIKTEYKEWRRRTHKLQGSLLHFGALRGYDQLVDAAWRFQLESRSNAGQTPMELALQERHVIFIEKLFRRGVCLPAQFESLLLESVRNGEAEFLTSLLASTLPDRVLGFYLLKQLFQAAISLCGSAIVSAIAKSPRVTASEVDILLGDLLLRLPAMPAEQHYFEEVLDILLAERRLEVSESYVNRWVGVLIDTDSFDLLERLRKRGADLDALDSSDYTGLMRAVEDDNENRIRKLLAMGASPDAGRGVWYLSNLSCFWRSFHILTETAPQGLNIYDSGPRVLHNCVLHAYDNGGEPSTYKALDYLLASGISIDSLDSRRFTPLMQAVEIGNVGLVQHLISKGASSESGQGVWSLSDGVHFWNVLQHLIEGSSPIEDITDGRVKLLHKAVLCSNTRAMGTFLQKSSSVIDYRHPEHGTMLDHAMRHAKWEIAMLLLDANAICSEHHIFMALHRLSHNSLNVLRTLVKRVPQPPEPLTTSVLICKELPWSKVLVQMVEAIGPLDEESTDLPPLSVGLEALEEIVNWLPAWMKTGEELKTCSDSKYRNTAVLRTLLKHGSNSNAWVGKEGRFYPTTLELLDAGQCLRYRQLDLEYRDPAVLANFLRTTLVGTESKLSLIRGRQFTCDLTALEYVLRGKSNCLPWTEAALMLLCAGADSNPDRPSYDALPLDRALAWQRWYKDSAWKFPDEVTADLNKEWDEMEKLVTKMRTLGAKQHLPGETLTFGGQADSKDPRMYHYGAGSSGNEWITFSARSVDTVPENRLVPRHFVRHPEPDRTSKVTSTSCILATSRLATHETLCTECSRLSRLTSKDRSKGTSKGRSRGGRYDKENTSRDRYNYSRAAAAYGAGHTSGDNGHGGGYCDDGGYGDNREYSDDGHEGGDGNAVDGNGGGGGGADGGDGGDGGGGFW